MAIDFPSSPTSGQQYQGYTYNSTIGAWQANSAAVAPSTVSANPPANPTVGDMWFNTNDGSQYFYYNDGNTSQWVEARAPITANGYYSPNYLINGGFDIWQRGTSLTTTANVYVADRWFGEGGNVTVSRQTAGAPASSTAYMRTAMTSTTFNNKIQLIESANVDPMHGKTVTLQAKLRRNSTFTGGLTMRIHKSATVDAGTGATWIEIGSVAISNNSLPTGTSSNDWFTQTLTAFVPNDGTANSLRVQIAQNTVEVSGAYWDMAEVQLEVGSVATAFRRNANSIQGELAACQRYYQQSWTPSAAGPIPLHVADGGLKTVAVRFSPEMRTAPTFSYTSSASVTQNGLSSKQWWAYSFSTGERYIDSWTASAEL